jgi:hypothetical protein
VHDDVLGRLNEWHIDIVKHDIDWGRMVIDAIEVIEQLRDKLNRWENCEMVTEDLCSDNKADEIEMCERCKELEAYRA